MTAPVLLLCLFAPPAPPPDKGAIGVVLEVQDGRFLITEIPPHAPARKAGLRPGDQILKTNDVPVKVTACDLDVKAFQREVGRHKAGQMVVVRIRRDGIEKSVEVIVGRLAELFPEEHREMLEREDR